MLSKEAGEIRVVFGRSTPVQVTGCCKQCRLYQLDLTGITGITHWYINLCRTALAPKEALCR